MIFVVAADALHLRSSHLSLDKRREQSHGADSIEIDRNDPSLVDSPKCADTSLVDAQRRDVNSPFEGRGASMNTWVAQVLE